MSDILLTKKIFPLRYKWTCLVALIFLGSLLWSATMLDGPGFIAIAVSCLCFFASVIASIVRVGFERSKASLYRLSINAAACLLVFPTIRLGDLVAKELFLKHLDRFEEATNLLTRNEAAQREGSLTDARLPPGYADLHVAEHVLISSKQGSITVRYISRDSSALGHRGYMYRSDDDPVALEEEFPHLGYSRLAPHWFSFSD